jgi:hypothetical protein
MDAVSRKASGDCQKSHKAPVRIVMTSAPCRTLPEEALALSRAAIATTIMARRAYRPRRGTGPNRIAKRASSEPLSASMKGYLAEIGDLQYLQ